MYYDDLDKSKMIDGWKRTTHNDPHYGFYNPVYLLEMKEEYMNDPFWISYEMNTSTTVFLALLESVQDVNQFRQSFLVLICYLACFESVIKAAYIVVAIMELYS